jgi:hypothetical protein
MNSIVELGEEEGKSSRYLEAAKKGVEQLLISGY